MSSTVWLGASWLKTAKANTAHETTTCPDIAGATPYDVIVFGDEVPGVMTALQVSRELRSHNHSNRVALITESNTDNGIGGHLVRGGLSYLDRNQVPANLQARYGTFGTPNQLYQEFLRMGRVYTIALHTDAVTQNFSTQLNRAGVTVVDNSELTEVHSTGSRLCALTAGGQTYSAEQFIDATQSGELAAASGIEMMQGLEALGFPDSSLSMGLVLDVHGMSIERFKAIEAELTERFLNPADAQAQYWLSVASGGDESQQADMLRSLTDYHGQPKLLHQATADSADVRSLAFSIAIHGQLGYSYDLNANGFLFDRANIAVLPDRLSFNALLFHADAATAQRLSREGARPTPEMRNIATNIAELFANYGATHVEIMDELYIRNTGQIANPVDELSATLMAAGGLPEAEALGTFGYHLDDRGGIEGLDDEVNDSVFRLYNLDQKPVFNYGFRHTLPQEVENLAVLGPASGFGGLGATAGRIVEFNVGVGEGLAIAIAQSISQDIPLRNITNADVRSAMGYTPAIYGYETDSFQAITSLEQRFRRFNYENDYIAQAESFFAAGNYAEADRALSRALILNPQNAEALYLRGNNLLQMEAFDLALTNYTEAVRIDPSLAESEAATYIIRGVEQAESGNRAEALAHFEEAVAFYQLKAQQ
ncbi:MAG: FAD-dependent oxidoreductase [Cyanobacteria bacterium J06627_28]